MICVPATQASASRLMSSPHLEEIIEQVDELVLAKRGKRLTPAELLLIEGAWHNQDHKEIASNSSYSLNYLQRTVARKLWPLLSEVLGVEEISKKSLRHCFEQLAVKNGYIDPSPVVVAGEPPQAINFYGRTFQLALLKEGIAKQRCLTIIGSAGIGKSTLAAKLIEDLKATSEGGFDCLIWRSISYAPLLPDLVTDLLQLLASSLELELDLSADPSVRISQLLDVLRSHRVLVVLDAAEAILREDINNRAHPYRDKYGDYGLFFRRLLEEEQQSCFILTSRQPFNDLALLETTRPIRSLKLEGLDRGAALEFLESQGLSDPEKCSELIQTYRGNPSYLTAVVDRIKHFFGGSLEKYFEYRTTFVNEAFLSQQFSSLNQIHQQIVLYLAKELSINPQPLPITKLLNSLKTQIAGISTSELFEVLEVLEARSLVEVSRDPVTQEATFNLQPVVKKYVLTDPSLVHKFRQNLKSA
ncbi:NB-ARC domain-containing protein [Merismopedia glauca]|uniref:AAA+ ATPase domain-containing protein n=1 Tax=Merismopedia glauca CCAP 1448/3 TaxID=1296344 RepID=A0A2T1C9N1_9CYAN|nr:NB-ARC domain-containing protein [Merismopedia glauca]PSB04949.1 hypothetical protein C7B64_01615 [Merismopedia glauca CCAP 1448/3]